MGSCASVTFEEVLALLFAIAPQFITDDPAQLARYEVLFNALGCQINCRLLGCCASLAFANLMAHYLVMGNNPYLGVGTSISEGQLSLGFASTVNGNFFGSTPYGQAYLNFIKNFKVGALVTNSALRWYGPACCGGY